MRRVGSRPKTVCRSLARHVANGVYRRFRRVFNRRSAKTKLLIKNPPTATHYIVVLRKEKAQGIVQNVLCRGGEGGI